MQRFVLMYEGRGRAPRVDVKRLREHPDVQTFDENAAGSILVDIAGSAHSFARYVRERSGWDAIPVVTIDLS
ncbi:hypothetical protein [Burkholderia cenocepacia]|uniref:hypothetical protein n=1 Tax=Burkholderia cenocepacia TaxID=95486 RepID=UPI000AA95015|nr:hypothetical protein [Burkholderia cenocepacia]